MAESEGVCVSSSLMGLDWRIPQSLFLSLDPENRQVTEGCGVWRWGRGEGWLASMWTQHLETEVASLWLPALPFFQFLLLTGLQDPLKREVCQVILCLIASRDFDCILGPRQTSREHGPLPPQVCYAFHAAATLTSWAPLALAFCTGLELVLPPGHLLAPLS